LDGLSNPAIQNANIAFYYRDFI